MTAIPNELWMTVFEELDSPSDLAAVVRTSKRFKSLGLRVLYRHVIWNDPRRFIWNHQFMQKNPVLRSVTRALTIGISTATSQLDRIEQISRARAIIHLTGEITFIPRPTRTHEARMFEEYNVDLLATDNVTDAMYSLAVTFANLRDLAFHGMVLPDTFYDFVHHFPALDKLAIINCTPPQRPHPTDRHPRDLPITELTILGLRGRRDPRDLREFGEAQQLRVVRFDSSCYIHKHFCEPPPPPPPPPPAPFVFVLPPVVNGIPPLHTLQPQPPAQPPPLFPVHQDPVPSPHIHTIDVKFPNQKSWQSFLTDPHDQIINPFADFLTRCPRVTNLRIRNYLPWLRLPETALPNLSYYQGPLSTIKSIVTGPRRLKHLTVRDPTGGLLALEKAFKEMEANGGSADLDTLSIFINRWDDEILYAVHHHFRGLKRLEIMYREGDPSEETVLGMGAHFFGQMTSLWSVRVFKLIPPVLDAITENVGARSYTHRSFQLLSEFIADGSERGDLDDVELEERLGAASSPSSPMRAARTAGQDVPEELLLLKELIHAWNRYCPALREIQLKAGYVWRRADTDDVWTQRPTKVCRMRDSGFENV